ncbi:hypothetical protein EV356DRAFT_491221 [Viridothelium virens]|uniref:DUF7702 domain-containing protein n=1 Tax=Viridothelium virens TaxID=1048519 RepID=A0A6A6GZK7_VIRVR|nr:hypothetical protein EV356DRAFT_491221 [Viridothelium virens]
MTLTDQGKLAIAEIVFYIPAGLLALYDCFKHGFGRSLAWVYIIVLSILRIAGSAITIYTENASDPSTTLVTTGIILASVGLSPLLNALVFMLKRVNEGMQNRRLPPILFRILEIVNIVAVVLVAYGGSKANTPSNSQDDKKTGLDMEKAGIIVFLITFFVTAAAALVTFTFIRNAIPGERRLVYFGIASLPFLFVRLVYSTIVIFENNQSTVFSMLDPNIWAESFMETLEEFIVVLLYLAAGLITPTIARDQVQGRTGSNAPWPSGPKYDEEHQLNNYNNVNPAYAPLPPTSRS